MDMNKVTKTDMRLIEKLIPYTSPAEIPLSFQYGDRLVRGIPADFHPRVERRLVDTNMLQIVVTGQDEAGLEIRAEYLEYRDFPVTEWIVFLTNRGEKNTPILSKIRVMDSCIAGSDPVLIHGNGDTVNQDGYEFFTDRLDHELSIAPQNGLGTHWAFPYMRLMFAEYGINLAIGWPAQWLAEFAPCEQGVHLAVGQQYMNMYMKPGETIRTPRMTLMGFTGDESRARNMWRRWYFKHILPREDGQPIPPKMCLHTWGIGGKQEFTAVTEENQVDAIDSYIRHGMKPDIWWIDAGWYPCDFTWTTTGNWWPNPDHFPNGLGPVGKKCEKEGIQFLL